MTHDIKFLIYVAAILSAAACTHKETQVSFAKDIMPIFQENCLRCHQQGGEGFLASGFSVESYETIMMGTKFGPVIQPGQSVASTLQALVEHKTDASIHMPKAAPKLPEDKIKLISTWIDQGAKNQ